LHLTAAKNAGHLTTILLEAGADVNTGILISQYTLLRRLKSNSTQSSSSSSSSPVGGGKLPKLKGYPTLKQAGLPPVDPYAKKKSVVYSSENEKSILPMEIAAANGHFDLAKLLLSR
jgi:ankyrin repeat protein